MPIWDEAEREARRQPKRQSVEEMKAAALAIAEVQNKQVQRAKALERNKYKPLRPPRNEHRKSNSRTRS